MHYHGGLFTPLSSLFLLVGMISCIHADDFSVLCYMLLLNLSILDLNVHETHCKVYKSNKCAVLSVISRTTAVKMSGAF